MPCEPLAQPVTSKHSQTTHTATNHQKSLQVIELQLENGKAESTKQLAMFLA